MLLSRSARSLLSVGLLFSCTPAATVRAPAPPPQPPAPDYLTIMPDVSVSRSAMPAEEKRAAMDPQADPMAEILAIPPGR